MTGRKLPKLWAGSVAIAQQMVNLSTPIDVHNSRDECRNLNGIPAKAGTHASPHICVAPISLRE